MCNLFGVGYFPKGIFPRATSQVATSQMIKIPRGNFPSVSLGPLRRHRLQQGRAFWLKWAKGPSTAARTGQGAERCGKDRKSPHGKLHIQDVATWVIPQRACGKVPNIICFSGVMGFPQTSMRDPIFYRWHTFIENFFLRYKVTPIIIMSWKQGWIVLIF